MKTELKIKGEIIKSVADSENLLCETGYIDTNGRCGIPNRNAVNKGSSCFQNKDCKTTDSSPGRCINSIVSSAKYCAPLENDHE